MAQFVERFVETKSSQVIVLRPIQIFEAEALLKAIYEIALTSEHILLTPENFKSITPEQEEKWIERYNSDPRGILIGADYNGRLVGVLNFAPYKDDKRKHRGVLGISLHHEFRNQGLGTALFEYLFALLKNDKELKYIELTVMSENKSAIALYKKVGFVELYTHSDSFRLKNGIVCGETTMRKENN